MSDVKPRAFSLTCTTTTTASHDSASQESTLVLCMAGYMGGGQFTNMFEHVRASHASTRDEVKLHEWKVLLGVYQEPVNHIPATLNRCSA